MQVGHFAPYLGKVFPHLFDIVRRGDWHFQQKIFPQSADSET